MKGAIRPVFVKEETPKTYEIIVRNNKFNPENLKIEKGSIVHWRIIEDSNDFQESDFCYSSTRSHVIAFENLMIESPRVKVNESFKVRFLECGHFTY